MADDSKSVREYVSQHVRVNEEKKTVYLVEDNVELSTMERFVVQSYLKGGYRIRIVKKAKSRNKDWFINHCDNKKEKGTFQSFLDEAKGSDETNAHLVAFRKAVDWFYEQHAELVPPSRQYRLEHEGNDVVEEVTEEIEGTGAQI